MSGTAHNAYGLNAPVFIVDLITITGRVHNVQSKSDSVFGDDYDGKHYLVNAYDKNSAKLTV
jgi:hypothetical protein